MFHGWRIVGISLAAQSLSVGTTFFIYGVFVKPLAAEFDAPRLVVVLGLTLLMFVQAVISPVLGRALDTGSIRTIMTSGSLLLAAGFLGLSVSNALWQVGLLFATVIAIGAHMFGPLATATLVANWFVRGRGRALGFTAFGASLGGLIFPVVATRLMESFGWRGAAAVFGGLLLVFALPLWLMVVSRPEDLGLHPDGEEEEEESGSTPTGDGGAKEGSLLGSLNFWVITAAVGLAFCPTSVLIAHLVPFATDLGIEPGRAALLISAYAGGGGVGRLALGALADRINKRVVTWLVFAMLFVSWSGLILAPSYPALFAASVGMGLGVGGIMPLWGALTGACFGRAVFGRAMGLMTPLMLPFNLLGAPVAAHVFDQTGSYTLVFSAFLATLVLGALAIVLLRIPRVEPGTRM
jgi:MFS family permease